MKSVRTWTRIEVLITNGKSANFFYSDKLHQIRSSCVAPQQRRRDDVTLFEFHAFYTQSSVVLFFLLHFDHEKRIAELLWTFSVLIDVFWFWWYVGVHLHLLINMTFDKRVLKYTLRQTINLCSKNLHYFNFENQLTFNAEINSIIGN